MFVCSAGLSMHVSPCFDFPRVWAPAAPRPRWVRIDLGRKLIPSSLGSSSSGETLSEQFIKTQNTPGVAVVEVSVCCWRPNLRGRESLPFVSVCREKENVFIEKDNRVLLWKAMWGYPSPVCVCTNTKTNNWKWSEIQHQIWGTLFSLIGLDYSICWWSHLEARQLKKKKEWMNKINIYYNNVPDWKLTFLNIFTLLYTLLLNKKFKDETTALSRYALFDPGWFFTNQKKINIVCLPTVKVPKSRKSIFLISYMWTADILRVRDEAF